MDEMKSTFPVLHLDLNNFDSNEAERSRYVLTSPRSLQSCARVGVKPVELLIKSLNELRTEQRDAPFEAVRVMHESYEKERRKLLQMCREERKKLIQADEDRWSSCKRNTKVTRSRSRIKLEDESAGQDTAGPVAYADLCFTGTSVSRSSCSAGMRDLDRSTGGSFSLGDLRHSSATERTLEKLTKEIKKEMCVTIPERDRKIAALMLVRHQEEKSRHELCHKEDQERQEARRQEEVQRAEAEKQRRKKLRRSMRRWHEELEVRRRLRECEEKEKAGQLEQEVQMQEDRWRRLKEEVEADRRGKREAALKEAEERKHHQERLLRHKEEVEKRVLEKERQVATEKEQKARRSKRLQEDRERQRLQEDNRRERLRCILMKQQKEQQVEEEEVQRRSILERKLQNSCKRRAEVVEARVRELQERATQEEEQIQRAQRRAQDQDLQEATHKQVLYELSQRRMEKATQHASVQSRNRAQQMYEHNQQRQLCHQKLRERRQTEEEAARRLREDHAGMKEWRRERLRIQRRHIQEEAQRLTRACFHMRDRVRQHTQTHTFDRMALDAQLVASIGHMKLTGWK